MAVEGRDVLEAPMTQAALDWLRLVTTIQKGHGNNVWPRNRSVPR